MPILTDDISTILTSSDAYLTLAKNIMALKGKYINIYNLQDVVYIKDTKYVKTGKSGHAKFVLTYNKQNDKTEYKHIMSVHSKYTIVDGFPVINTETKLIT